MSRYSGQITRLLNEKLGDSPSILDYTVGGGDWGVYFNNAMASRDLNTGSVGRLLMQPEGDQVITTPMVMNQSVELIGCGRMNRLVPNVGANPLLTITRDLARTPPSFLLPNSDLAYGQKIHDLWIEDTAFRSGVKHGIQIKAVTELDLHNCFVYGLKGYALLLGDPGTSLVNTVTESSFHNFVSWECGDHTSGLTADGCPVIWLVTPATCGDEVNEIHFFGGGVKQPWGEAVRIDTALAGSYGPRWIYWHSGHLEGREVFVNESKKPTTAAPSHLVHCVQASQFIWNGGTIAVCGPQKACIKVTCAVGTPMNKLVMQNAAIGGTNGATFTCDITHFAVTWLSGDKFTIPAEDTWVGAKLYDATHAINYTVASVTDDQHATIVEDPGVVGTVSATVYSGGKGIEVDYLSQVEESGNTWLNNPLGNYVENHPLTSVAGAPATARHGLPSPFPVDAALGKLSADASDAVFELENLATGGKKWKLDSQDTGDFLLFEDSSAAAVILGHDGIAHLNGVQAQTTASRVRMFGTEFCAALVEISSDQFPLIGVVDVAGDGVTVSWDSGAKFDNAVAGDEIRVAGQDRLVATWTNNTSLVLNTSVGPQTSVAYSIPKKLVFRLSSADGTVIWDAIIMRQYGTTTGEITLNGPTSLPGTGNHFFDLFTEALHIEDSTHPDRLRIYHEGGSDLVLRDMVEDALSLVRLWAVLKAGAEEIQLFGGADNTSAARLNLVKGGIKFPDASVQTTAAVTTTALAASAITAGSFPSGDYDFTGNVKVGTVTKIASTGKLSNIELDAAHTVSVIAGIGGYVDMLVNGTMRHFLTTD